MPNFLAYIEAVSWRWAIVGIPFLVSLSDITHRIAPGLKNWLTKKGFHEDRRRRVEVIILALVFGWANCSAFLEERAAHTVATSQLTSCKSEASKWHGIAIARASEISRMSSEASKPVQQIPGIAEQIRKQAQQGEIKAREIRQLKDFYRDGASIAANIWMRPSEGNGTTNPYFAKNAAAATAWSKRTGDWIRANLGEAALDRFYEQEPGPSYMHPGMTPEQGEFAERVNELRKNLREMIQTGSW